jgi:hypothetical protein
MCVIFTPDFSVNWGYIIIINYTVIPFDLVIYFNVRIQSREGGEQAYCQYSCYGTILI